MLMGRVTGKHYGNVVRRALFPSLPHAMPDVKNEPNQKKQGIKRWSIISSLHNKMRQNFDKGEGRRKASEETGMKGTGMETGKNVWTISTIRTRCCSKVKHGLKQLS
jgi:hypothetical protein